MMAAAPTHEMRDLTFLVWLTPNWPLRERNADIPLAISYLAGQMIIISDEQWYINRSEGYTPPLYPRSESVEVHRSAPF